MLHELLHCVFTVLVIFPVVYQQVLFSSVHRQAIESIWITARGLSTEDMVRHEWPRRVVTVLVWFSSSLLIALGLPDIGVVISLLGGLAALFAFMFPGQAFQQ